MPSPSITSTTRSPHCFRNLPPRLSTRQRCPHTDSPKGSPKNLCSLPFSHLPSPQNKHSPTSSSSIQHHYSSSHREKTINDGQRQTHLRFNRRVLPPAGRLVWRCLPLCSPQLARRGASGPEPRSFRSERLRSAIHRQHVSGQKADSA